jgi:hypothetical protein
MRDMGFFLMYSLFMPLLMFGPLEALLLAGVLVDAFRVGTCKAICGDHTITFEAGLISKWPRLAARAFAVVPATREATLVSTTVAYVHVHA